MAWAGGRRRASGPRGAGHPRAWPPSVHTGACGARTRRAPRSCRCRASRTSTRRCSSWRHPVSCPPVSDVLGERGAAGGARGLPGAAVPLPAGVGARLVATSGDLSVAMPGQGRPLLRVEAPEHAVPPTGPGRPLGLHGDAQALLAELERAAPTYGLGLGFALGVALAALPIGGRVSHLGVLSQARGGGHALGERGAPVARGSADHGLSPRPSMRSKRDRSSGSLAWRLTAPRARRRSSAGVMPGVPAASSSAAFLRDRGESKLRSLGEFTVLVVPV